MSIFTQMFSRGADDLIYAIKNENMAKFDQLMKKKPALEFRESLDGKTALHFACIKSNMEMVKKLIQAGAKVDAQDKAGRTPLMCAVATGGYEIVKLLLDRGAEINRKEKFYQWTPLLFAALNGHQEIVRLLLSRGADPKIKSKGGPYYDPAAAARANHHHEIAEQMSKLGR
jgi:ankyrin repeat protein